MKTFIFTLAFLVSSACFAQVNFEEFEPQPMQQSNINGEYAQVISVTPVNSHCYQPTPRVGLGNLIGGVLGGVIGHQFGKGRGKTASTIAGASIGAVAPTAYDMAAQRANCNQQSYYNNDDSNIDHYRVKYLYQNRIGYANTNQYPGEYFRVQ